MTSASRTCTFASPSFNIEDGTESAVVVFLTSANTAFSGVALCSVNGYGNLESSRTPHTSWRTNSRPIPLDAPVTTYDGISS